MACDNFVPDVWSARILKTLQKSLVAGSIVNTDYEGDITQAGDTVKINSVGAPTVASYVKNSTSISPEELSDAQTKLEIDTAQYYAFKVDDVDKAQQLPGVMDEAMRQAAYALKDEADQDILELYGDAGVTSALGTTAVPIDITSVNILATLNKVARKLDDVNVPRDGRWMIIPPWLNERLVLSKVMVDNSKTNDTYANGFVGRVAGFDLRMSNNVYNSASKFKILAGVKRAISFAGQITSTEAYRPEASFSDAVKGLYVYGCKVVYPACLACLTATEGTEPT